MNKNSPCQNESQPGNGNENSPCQNESQPGNVNENGPFQNESQPGNVNENSPCQNESQPGNADENSPCQNNKGVLVESCAVPSAENSHTGSDIESANVTFNLSKHHDLPEIIVTSYTNDLYMVTYV